jgi:hypothetical protein
VAPIDAMFSGAVPVFVSAEVFATLVVPTRCEPKSRLPGDRLTWGAAGAPVPLRLSSCGLPGASSAIETAAFRVPVPAGVNVTVIEQVAFGASVAGETGHVFDMPNSAERSPIRLMLVIVSGDVPVFRSVEDCEALVVPTTCDAYVRLAGVSDTAGWTPVPLSATVCGEPVASSAIEMPALRAPVADGENVAEIVHVALTASVAGLSGQVLVEL